MARLIKTEKEVEGRYEDVWLVVEEDALEQWPAGPLEVVGRPAPRVDGPERVRGEATYTADLQLPGMLHTAVLRSPHATRACNADRPRAALAAPGVRAAIGPDDVDALTDECGYEGAAVAAVVRRHARRRPARASRLIDVEWEVLEPLLDPEEAVARGESSSTGRAATSAATSSAGSPRPTWSSRPSTGRRSCSTTRWRRTRPSATGRATRSTVYISTQYIWGVRGDGREALGLPRGQGARRLRVHGRRLRRQERPGRLHVHRRRARAAHGPAGAAAR